MPLTDLISERDEFNGSGALVLDGTGNIYVGDGNGRIQKFQLHPPLVPAAIATQADLGGRVRGIVR